MMMTDGEKAGRKAVSDGEGNGSNGRKSSGKRAHEETQEGDCIGRSKGAMGREGQTLDGGSNQRTGRCIRVLYHLDFCGRYDPGKPILEAGSRCDFGRLGIVLCYPFCALGVGNTRAMGKLKRGEGLR